VATNLSNTISQARAMVALCVRLPARGRSRERIDGVSTRSAQPTLLHGNPALQVKMKKVKSDV
jgi:hypothetical protein